jgi:hypothetical protein
MSFVLRSSSACASVKRDLRLADTRAIQGAGLFTVGGTAHELVFKSATFWLVRALVSVLSRGNVSWFSRRIVQLRVGEPEKQRVPRRILAIVQKRSPDPCNIRFTLARQPTLVHLFLFIMCEFYEPCPDGKDYTDESVLCLH